MTKIQKQARSKKRQTKSITIKKYLDKQGQQRPKIKTSKGNNDYKSRQAKSKMTKNQTQATSKSRQVRLTKIKNQDKQGQQLPKIKTSKDNNDQKSRQARSSKKSRQIRPKMAKTKT